MSLAVTKRKKSIIILAIIAPIIAIVVSMSMLYDYYTKNGNNVNITLSNIDGLDIQQSHIQYNGLHIGKIIAMNLDKKDLNKFIIHANIYEKYNYLIRKGSIFYKVSPKVSLTETTALSNVLKGNYIELIPVTQDIPKLKILKKQLNFIGYDEKPKTNGTIFNISSNDGSFGVSSSILYKGLQIGEVIDKSIDKYTVNYQVLIYEKYKYLISSTTKFYQINPLEINASLENIKIKIPSIKNLLSSSIGFLTPSYDKEIKKTYNLYSSIDEINMDNKNKDDYPFRIKADGISKNEFILYKGVIVGQINSVKIEKDINIVSGKNILRIHTFT